ncbi:MAG: hypothetical protein CMD92_00745 [Gammaproteobacteria bacterium]|nr:hypothetical protein [Gammaproteobacteria bacterium]
MNMIKEMCTTDINTELGVCALTGCKKCNVFMLTIGPMSFRLDGLTLNELITMLREFKISEQYEESLVNSFSPYSNNLIEKH